MPQRGEPPRNGVQAGEHGHVEGTVTPLSEAGKRKCIHKIYWRVLPWIFILSILNYFDRANIAYAAPTLKRDLHISNSQYGLATGLLFVGYATVQIPSQLMITKVGAPLWLACLCLSWGIVTASQTAVTSVHGFYACRFFLGLVEAGTYPGINYMLSRFLTPEEMKFSGATITMSTALSNVFGGLFAAALLLLDGKGGLHGWQWIFLVEGLMTFCYGLVVKWLLVESPAKTKWLTPPEKAWLIQRQTDAEDAIAAKHKMGSKWWGFLLVWQTYYLGITSFCVYSCSYGIQFFTPLIVDALQSHRFNGITTQSKPKQGSAYAHHTAVIALISAILFVPCAITTVANALLSMWARNRRFFAAVPMTLAAIMFLVMPKVVDTSGFIPAYVVLIIAAASVWAAYAPINSWPQMWLTRTGYAVGYGLYNTIDQFAGFAGPYIVGDLSNTGSYVSSVHFFGGMSFAAAFLVLIFPMPDRSRQYEAAHVAARRQSDEESSEDTQPEPLSSNTAGADALCKTAPIIYEESFKA